MATITPSQNTKKLNYAGFWRRCLARLIDEMIVDIPFMVISIFFGKQIGLIVFLVTHWIYAAVLISSREQATLGMQATAIKVSFINGKKITFTRATGRHFASLFSNLTFGIGYIMAGFTERHQTLHDMLTDCVVLKKYGACLEVGVFSEGF